tara:strand:+ start:2320 stop:3813 length:1494 start_codon:yes stop_codon:yes gene_type:complete
LFLFLILFVLISNSLFSNSRFSDNIILYLDPVNISTFVLDRYHPYQNLDINYFSIIIDGSVNMPLYHLKPEKLYFKNDDISNAFSQLSFKQNKNDDYFNTKIAMVNQINESTESLFQLESKSLVDNINQNGFLNIKKTNENFSFNISYLYHYDQESNQYELNTVNTDYKKENESFSSGYNMLYKIDNITFKSDFSIQTSYHKRSVVNLLDDYEYLVYNERFISSSNKLNYNFGNVSLFLKNINYDFILENDINEVDIFNNHYNVPSLGIISNINKFKFKIYGSNIDNFVRPNAEFIYTLDNIGFAISSEYYIKGLLIDSDELYGEYKYNEYCKENINISLDFSKYKNIIDIGKIKSDTISYSYFLLSGNIDYKMIDFDYKYFKYFDKQINVGIDQYANFGLSFFPFKDKNEFDLYGKVNYNYYVMDSDINLLTMNLFENTANQKTVQLYNFEFGFVFDYFKISYNSKNLLSNNVVFSNTITPFKRFDYINVIWVFKD